jgi:hypothetical protein
LHRSRIFHLKDMAAAAASEPDWKHTRPLRV